VSDIRQYQKENVIHFRKTKEKYGWLSNMASGYKVKVNSIIIYSSEALYQACKFPAFPEIQKEIISQKSPMTAKMISRREKENVRADWMKIRVNVMRWALRVKLICNKDSFGQLLLSTNNKPIVELSNKDDFWGSFEKENNLLVGTNALGRLLMELREDIMKKNLDNINSVAPLNYPEFLLLGKKISEVRCNQGDLNYGFLTMNSGFQVGF
tara:strand:- start:1075 stop:1707 length:633 start_codon:yes stop_codon:yes gene_type:complete